MAPSTSAVKRRTGSSTNRTNGSSSGVGLLRFIPDDSTGLKIGPTVVLGMSLAFVAFVIFLHVLGKLYR